jgi:ACS family pantothenate transporter-like MFS transporter
MVNPLIFGWANIILQRSGDDAVRSVTLYSMNIGSMVLWTFWGILFYSAADAPYWKKGSIALLACCGVMFGYVWAVWKVRRRRRVDRRHQMRPFANYL